MAKDMDEFDRKLAKARGIDPDAEADESAGSAKAKATAMAMRMAVELFSGVLVGTAMGYGIDWLVGTTPIFLIIFMMLGAVAGFQNLYRSMMKDD